MTLEGGQAQHAVQQMLLDCITHSELHCLGPLGHMGDVVQQYLEGYTLLLFALEIITGSAAVLLSGNYYCCRGILF